MIIFHYFNKEYCPIMTLWTNNLHFSATFVKVLDKLILHYRTFQNNWASFQYNKCGICRECWDNDTLCVNISMQGLWVFLFVRPYINVTSGILFIPFWSDTPSAQPSSSSLPLSLLNTSSFFSILCVCNPAYSDVLHTGMVIDRKWRLDIRDIGQWCTWSLVTSLSF